jgi:arsenical pump membrane protein
MIWFTLSLFFGITILVFWCAIKKPYFQFGKFSFESYALAAFLGPILFFITGFLSFTDIGSLFVSQDSPIHILILFLSMVFLSIYLDEVGVLEYVAQKALYLACESGVKLFFILYSLVSILTIFTSNDIVILTLTPFIYYFAKHARINPKPYLLAQFFAANTWSILLLIGNPTNIYAASFFDIGFFAYLQVMFIPALVAGIVNIVVLYFLFKKEISLKLSQVASRVEKPIRDSFGAKFGTTLLIICTLFLVISDFIIVEMWKISLFFAVLLGIVIFSRRFFHTNFVSLSQVFVRVPWMVILFVISYFLMTSVLLKHNVIDFFVSHLSWFMTDKTLSVLIMGFASGIIANVLNNIPMTVVFSQIVSFFPFSTQTASMYAVIIGSNVGAYFTPIGALAGIMWMSILKSKGIDLSYREFIYYGLCVGILTLGAALIALLFMV